MKKIICFVLFLVCFSSFIFADNYTGFIILNNENNNIYFADNVNKSFKSVELSDMIIFYIIFESIQNGLIGLQDEITYQDKKHTIESLINKAILNKDRVLLNLITNEIFNNKETLINALNEKAQELGLNNTKFKYLMNSNHLEQGSNTKDMMTILIALHKKFPAYMLFFENKFYFYNGTVLNVKKDNAFNFYGLTGYQIFDQINNCYHTLGWGIFKKEQFLISLICTKSKEDANLLIMKKISDITFSYSLKNDNKKKNGGFLKYLIPDSNEEINFSEMEKIEINNAEDNIKFRDRFWYGL